MAAATKARAVGFNHVAIEVGDIDAALAFYGRLFEFHLRSKNDSMAFIDLGDQFLALQKGRTQPADDGRHFGLVVDDKEAARKALADAGIKTLPGPFLDFLDPWGNRVEICRLYQCSIHEGTECVAGHGPHAPVEERDGDQRTHGQRHGAKMKRRELLARTSVHLSTRKAGTSASVTHSRPFAWRTIGVRRLSGRR